MWLSLTSFSELSFASRDPLRSSLLSDAALATTRSCGEGDTSSVCLRWSRGFPLLPSLSLSSCPATIALGEKENTKLKCFSSLNLLLYRGNLETGIMRAVKVPVYTFPTLLTQIESLGIQQSCTTRSSFS